METQSKIGPNDPAVISSCGKTLSQQAYLRAQRVFPGGTTRATIQRDPFPTYADYGAGAYIFDIDGERHLDLANNFTTLVHGHAFAPVVEALNAQARRGTCFGNPTTHEIDLAELIIGRIPCADHIRFVNTGTEAVMHALKAARSITGRKKIAKIEGAYHGAYDWAEISESSSPSNWGSNNPNSVAVCRSTPKSVLDDVIVLPFNDSKSADRILRKHANDLAAILIDPMPSRAGLLPATPDFLGQLRSLADEFGALLICDEVLNFRMSYHGAAHALGVTPDIITLGKIIGGGMPIGAIVGPADIMDVFSVDNGATPQGGTFSANPMSMIAGYVSMSHLKKESFDHLESMGDEIRRELRKMFLKTDFEMSVTGRGSLFRIHPFAKQPTTYREAFKSSTQIKMLVQFNQKLKSGGLSMAKGGLGALSTPMGDREVSMTLNAFHNAIQKS